MYRTASSAFLSSIPVTSPAFFCADADAERQTSMGGLSSWYCKHMYQYMLYVRYVYIWCRISLHITLAVHSRRDRSIMRTMQSWVLKTCSISQMWRLFFMFFKYTAVVSIWLFFVFRQDVSTTEIDFWIGTSIVIVKHAPLRNKTCILGKPWNHMATLTLKNLGHKLLHVCTLVGFSVVLGAEHDFLNPALCSY